MGFRLFVYGLWFGLIWILLVLIGESINPGSLSDTAFTDIGLLSLFFVPFIDSFFTLGSVE